MALKRITRKFLRSLGLDVRRYTPSAATLLQRLFELYRVDTILDVGANAGQSGEHFRSIGFTHKMVSFEPIKYLFEKLKDKAQSDPLWFVENVALGRSECQAEINVSGGHAGASSILEMTENVITHAPKQQVVRKELIEVSTLDAILNKYYPENDRCFLKLDVQGYEKSVLEGGLSCIDRVVGMKIELSLVENYKGETLFLEMLPFLYSLGFRLVCFENGWGNSVTGELYQVDCTLFRTNLVSGTKQLASRIPATK